MPTHGPKVPRELKDGHNAFLVQNMELLAASMWRGYQDDGPGALLVMGFAAEEGPTWTEGHTPAMYASRTALKFLLQETDNEATYRDLRTMIAEANFKRAVIVAFINPDRTISSYRLHFPDLTPPDAYARYGYQLSEMALTVDEFAAALRRAEGDGGDER